MTDDAYRPMMSDEYAATLRRWHEAASLELHRSASNGSATWGSSCRFPSRSSRSTPMSDLLGRTVLAEVRDRDRVLDMGTGSGVNAILAASRSHDVVGVDINPHAVAAATRNAERNNVAGRTRFYESDVFERVDGSFDLIMFDPPFRWFRPRDVLEMSVTDETTGL